MEKKMTKEFHPDYPIEITGMSEEQIKKEIFKWKKNRDWTEECIKDNDPDYLKNLQNKKLNKKK